MRFPLIDFLTALWRFSRPHTIYGTTASVLGLSILAMANWSVWIDHLPDLGIALLACLCTNVYIVGLNQLTDVEIDRINKPDLPLASGALRYNQGLGIVIGMGVAGLSLSLLQIPYLLLTVLLSGLIGTVYSLPPIRLKRYPITAALCIYGVRGLVVNLGLYAGFRSLIQAPVLYTPPLIALVLFILVFGFVIAIFKDIPDIEGDRQFRIVTYSIQWGQQRVLDLSIWVLSLCYLAMIGLGYLFLSQANPWLLAGVHLVGLGILWGGRVRTQVEDQQALTGLYQLIWKLFYLEYLLYPFIFITRGI